MVRGDTKFSKRRAEKRSAFRRSELGHTPGMPDYRHNRVPGGTFFTVNLRDPRADLLVTQNRHIARRGSPDALRYALPHRRLVCPPRSYALPADLATRRCRLPRS